MERGDAEVGKRMTINFQMASEQDFERLLALRLRTMRPSLERLGRFDPERARQRFRATFDPGYMRLIFEGDAFVGCVTVRPEPGGDAWLEHFYIEPEHQGRGLGDHILRSITADADLNGTTLRLGVLRESDANRFYVRHGFTETHRAQWDVYYSRPPAG